MIYFYIRSNLYNHACYLRGSKGSWVSRVSCVSKLFSCDWDLKSIQEFFKVNPEATPTLPKEFLL